MTMLQIHMDALNSVPVAYHEFLIRYKANANIVYGIVEGKEDPMFYRGLIERHLPEGWEVELIPAGCKDKVISAKNAFDWSRFSPNRICFFIDRDLSELIEDGTISGDNVYITDNYSIENDAVNIGVLKRLLVEIFNIHDLEPTEWEVIYQRFSSALSDFQDFMVPIMAQIILWRRSGKRPCLNDIQPKDFFFFKHGEIKFRTNFESSLSRLEHAGKCVKLQPSHNTEVSYAENEFRQRNGPERLIRGKYLLWFLVAFALEVHSSISVLIDRLDESPKVRISIGLANAKKTFFPVF